MELQFHPGPAQKSFMTK